MGIQTVRAPVFGLVGVFGISLSMLTGCGGSSAVGRAAVVARTVSIGPPTSTGCPDLSRQFSAALGKVVDPPPQNEREASGVPGFLSCDFGISGSPDKMYVSFHPNTSPQDGRANAAKGAQTQHLKIVDRPDLCPGAFVWQDADNGRAGMLIPPSSGAGSWDVMLAPTIGFDKPEESLLAAARVLDQTW